MKADMHVHTYASDGLFSPEEAVNTALSNGVKLLAVTDHDTILSVDRVLNYASTRGLCAISGVEVSAYVGDVKIHMLGYSFDLNSKSFNAFMEKLRQNSIERAKIILSRLSSAGVVIPMEEVLKERKLSNSPVHAMHIARCGARRGYAADPFSFYKNFMLLGKVGYSNAFRPTPEQAIEEINAAGGLSSLAHPGRIELEKPDLEALILRLSQAGLGGIEGVYSTHTVKDTAYFKELAKKCGLVVTGGSDCHWANGSRKIGDPNFDADGELLARLKIC